MASLTKIIKKYAQKKYNQGWDVVIECLSDSEIYEITKGADTEMGAKRLMSKFLKARADYAADIQGA